MVTPICLFPAVLPETLVQLLPITSGMHSWVRYKWVWWHINNWVTTSLHQNPSHAPLLAANTDSSCQTPGLSESWSRECVSMCVWVCVPQGGEFMGSWYLINWADKHTNGFCFVSWVFMSEQNAQLSALLDTVRLQKEKRNPESVNSLLACSVCYWTFTPCRRRLMIRENIFYWRGKPVTNCEKTHKLLVERKNALIDWMWLWMKHDI